jgi:hypothetical protein
MEIRRVLIMGEVYQGLGGRSLNKTHTPNCFRENGSFKRNFKSMTKKGHQLFDRGTSTKAEVAYFSPPKNENQTPTMGLMINGRGIVLISSWSTEHKIIRAWIASDAASSYERIQCGLQCHAA